MQNDNQQAASGTLGAARNRSNNPKAPGYNGSLVFDQDVPAGTKLYLSGWLRDGQNGQFFSIVAQFPFEKETRVVTARPAPMRQVSQPMRQVSQPMRRPMQQQQVQEPVTSYDDEIPF